MLEGGGEADVDAAREGEITEARAASEMRGAVMDARATGFEFVCISEAPVQSVTWDEHVHIT